LSRFADSGRLFVTRTEVRRAGSITVDTVFSDVTVPRDELVGQKPIQDEPALIREFQAIVGRSHVLTSPEATRRFRTGIRFGSGPVIAVVRPGSLVEQWRVLRACVGANKVVIMQASNTGVTGGSTPDGDDYDRGVVLINTMRITGLHLINDGMQVVCLPGTTLFHLEKALERVGDGAVGHLATMARTHH